MNTLDLQAIGLEEMAEVETMNVDGGIVGAFLLAAAVWVAWDIAMNPKDAYRQLEAGYQSR